MKWYTLIFFILTKNAHADMTSSHQEGSQHGTTLQEKHRANLPHINSQDVPQFSPNPKEAELYKSENLGNATEEALRNSAVAKDITEAATNRQRFEIDPETDPLFQIRSKKSAEEELNMNGGLMKEQKKDPIKKNCEEGGEDIISECFENRYVAIHVPVKSTTLSVNHLQFEKRTKLISVQVRGGSFFRHSKREDIEVPDGYSTTLPTDISAFKNVFCQGFIAKDIHTNQFYNIDCSKIIGFSINGATSISENNGIQTILIPNNNLNITLQHQTFEGNPGEETDEWQSNCDGLENMVNEGLCHYGERLLTQGAGTRNINSYQITKDAWQYKQIYQCKMFKNECASLRAEGCYQVASQCKEKKGDRCWIFNQTYECPNGEISHAKIKSPIEAFCLSGECHNTSYKANEDILNVITQLSLLKEIQNDIKTQGSNNFQIFKGNPQQCSRDCLSFKDCCGGLKGWGVSLHIAGCKPDEKALAKMRQENLCHQVGTYCAKKVLKKCVTKKTSFCCFGNKLARLLQEQGRAQLNIGWGTPECPDCRGLTVEELSRLDLSKMNFGELFEDIINKYKAPDSKDLQEKTQQKLQQNMKNINPALKTNPKSGVLEGNKDGL